MIAPVRETYRGQIIELGAGNGALTLRLAQKCPSAVILAYEVNPTLAHDTRCRLAKAGISGRVEVIADSAHNLATEMRRRRIAKADYVISGIPLGSLGRQKALALIDTISTVLGQGGLYVQFQHSLIDRNNIRTRFSKMRMVPVLLNLPPAVVYYAQR